MYLTALPFSQIITSLSITYAVQIASTRIWRRIQLELSSRSTTVYAPLNAIPLNSAFSRPTYLDSQITTSFYVPNFNKLHYVHFIDRRSPMPVIRDRRSFKRQETST